MEISIRLVFAKLAKTKMLASPPTPPSAPAAPSAQNVRDASVRIKVRMSRTAQDIIEIGRDLIVVKKLLGHGNFMSWCDAEFGMSQWTAVQFMNAERNLGGKFEIISNLPPTVLYALAAPSTPEPVREQAVERVKAGGTVTAATPLSRRS